MPERSCIRWRLLALSLAVPLFAALVLFGGGLQGDTALYAGGFNPVSAGKCLWEALVCVGMGLLMLAVYRRHFDAAGAGRPMAFRQRVRRLSDPSRRS